VVRVHDGVDKAQYSAVAPKALSGCSCSGICTLVKSRLRNVILRHRNAIKIPTGFQEEVGLHFGAKPDN